MTSTFSKMVIAVLLALAAQIGIGTETAQAQYFTYVSSSGADANDCASTATPCRNFQRAENVLSDGGTIVCMNAAYYSAFSITKSLTIDCRAGGGAFDTQGIFINAPGKTVRLRNLSVNGLLLSLTEVISIAAADTVELTNVFVAGSVNFGIKDTRAGPGMLVITDSFVQDNNGPGIVIAPSSGTIAAVLDNVRTTHNSYGLAVGVGGRVMINRSVFSGNSIGIEADSGAIIAIDGTLVSNSGTGVVGNSNVTISNSSINSNNTAISGAVRTYGNNRIAANLSDGTPMIPVGGLSSENGLR